MTDAFAWKIVLIDDEEDIREVMSVSLEDEGYRVFTAENGRLGLDLCEKESPQIVITDIRMPVLDGLQVLESIKQQSPQVEVIVATAFGEMELAIRALQLDASDFIHKPINHQELHLALKRARERYRSRKTLADYTALLEKENAETSQQLLRNIEFQKNLIESSMDGICACDAEGRIVSFNRSMEEISGYVRAEVLGRMTLEELLAAGEGKRLRTALQAKEHGGKNRLSLFETTLLANPDRSVPVQVSASILRSLGQRDGLVCFFRDLREIRRLEREMADQARILHQDKMMSLGKLAASVVHEINNPLSGILNYLRLMSRIIDRGPISGEQQKKFERYLELVENETERCSQIVSSLLTFSRKSPPHFGRVDIEELLQRCMILSQHKMELSDIEPSCRVDKGLPPVRGDFNQLQQSIINLIFNAIDAMPDGGRLQLEGRFDPDKKHVQITVTDNGQGIDPQDLPHIFEPFFTTKSEGFGVGLGLSTMYGIIEHHNGTVDVQSSKGKGTTFTIRLPAAPGEDER
jgi:PAS domain S-box-containing protein